MNKKLLISVGFIIFLVAIISIYFINRATSISDWNIANNQIVPPVTNQATTSVEVSQYQNIEYGFVFSLPVTWNNYSVVLDAWRGQILGAQGTTEAAEVISGPEILIRHPEWTAENPRQDIPIMVFTLDQWGLVQDEKMVVSAAPIGPRELGRNANYVFALPARYNYALITGYEEVEEILQGNPLLPIEAVYLKPKDSGQISEEALRQHPEILEVNSFEVLQASVANKVAIWIDKDAVDLVEEGWLSQAPQKNYPLIMVGYNNGLYSFRDKLSVGTIHGPKVDWSVQKLEPGFSIWMIKEVTENSLSATMKGFSREPNLEALLIVTNQLLGKKSDYCLTACPLVDPVWTKLSLAISNCEVNKVAQTHDNVVKAELKNGDKLEAFEPNIDDVITLAGEVKEKCGQIAVSTE